MKLLDYEIDRGFINKVLSLKNTGVELRFINYAGPSYHFEFYSNVGSGTLQVNKKSTLGEIDKISDSIVRQVNLKTNNSRSIF